MPWAEIAAAPATAGSQSMLAPAASIASTAAEATSGPMPSPRMSVTGVPMARALY